MSVSPEGTQSLEQGQRPGTGRLAWRRIRAIVGTALGALMVLVLVAAIFLAVVTRTSQAGVPRFMGHSALVILSGSMTPTFDAGDLIVDQAVITSQAAHLHRGQVITFEAGPPSAPASVLITHRIYRVTMVQSPVTYRLVPRYETKGDANPVPDGNALQPSQIIGVYQFRIPFGGYVLNILHQPIVFILLVTSPFAVIAIGEGSRRWRAAGSKGPGDGEAAM